MATHPHPPARVVAYTAAELAERPERRIDDQARLYSRRLNAALRSTAFPKARLANLAGQLRAYRGNGDHGLLASWLFDYRPALDGELASATKYRRD